MDLFDQLQEQINAVRLPLFAVTVTAAAHINTPLIVLLHWHGFRRATPLVLLALIFLHVLFLHRPSR